MQQIILIGCIYTTSNMRHSHARMHFSPSTARRSDHNTLTSLLLLCSPFSLSPLTSLSGVCITLILPPLSDILAVNIYLPSLSLLLLLHLFGLLFLLLLLPPSLLHLPSLSILHTHSNKRWERKVEMGTIGGAIIFLSTRTRVLTKKGLGWPFFNFFLFF